MLSWPHMQVLEEQSSTQTQYWKQSAQHVTTGTTTPHSLQFLLNALEHLNCLSFATGSLRSKVERLGTY